MVRYANQALMSKLLECTECDLDNVFIKVDLDHLADYGLSKADIPQLVDLVQQWQSDEFCEEIGDTEESFLPLIACRVLGQLQATAAIKPLLGMLNELSLTGDEVFWTEFPEVFTAIGPEAMQPLINFLADEENDVLARGKASECLARLAKKYPECRSQTIAAHEVELRRFEERREEFYALLVATLLDLDAQEAAATLEQLHSKNLVDTAMCGKWESVQQQLGIQGLGLPMPEQPHNSIAGCSKLGLIRIASRLFEDGELDEDLLDEQITQLHKLFGLSPEFDSVEDDYRDWPGSFLNLAARYLGSSFLSVCRSDAEEILFELFPRKVSTHPKEARRIIQELRCFFEFVSANFDAPHAGSIVAFLTPETAQSLEEELGDEDNFGMAKSLFMMGEKAGFDMTSQQDLDDFVTLYNASLSPPPTQQPPVGLQMSAGERRAFDKARKKQLAQAQKKRKKK